MRPISPVQQYRPGDGEVSTPLHIRQVPRISIRCLLQYRVNWNLSNSTKSILTLLNGFLPLMFKFCLFHLQDFQVNRFPLFQSRDPVFCRPRLGCAEVCAQGSTTMPTWGRVVPSTTDVVAATLITSRPEICVRRSVGFEVSAWGSDLPRYTGFVEKCWKIYLDNKSLLHLSCFFDILLYI